ncbi:MAG: ferrous iron transport protein A [Candidatus Berkiella sp.]
MLTLDAIPSGKQVRMKGFQQSAKGYRHKLLAMGLTPGVAVTVVRVAPLGDPIQIQLRGYTLSLRKKECQQIEVEY